MVLNVQPRRYLPAPYKVFCDDAFYTKDFLEGKSVKTKELYIEDE